MIEFRCAALAALFGLTAALLPGQEVTAIGKVETGLTRKVQIKGEPVPKWTIAERLQHYHVPGATATLAPGT